MVPLTEPRPPQQAELYTLELVQKTAEQQHLQPPLHLEEAIAIHGLLNQTHPKDPSEADFRFDILKSAWDIKHGQPADPRLIVLNSFLRSFRLG